MFFISFVSFFSYFEIYLEYIIPFWISRIQEYIYVECEDEDTFSKTIKYLEDHSIPLVGTVHDFTCPQTGENYMFFPIRKL